MLAGQSSTVISWSSNHLEVVLALWVGCEGFALCFMFCFLCLVSAHGFVNCFLGHVLLQLLLLVSCLPHPPRQPGQSYCAQLSLMYFPPYLQCPLPFFVCWFMVIHTLSVSVCGSTRARVSLSGWSCALVQSLQFYVLVLLLALIICSCFLLLFLIFIQFFQA